MKNIILGLLICISFLCSAQTETLYCRDRSCQQEVEKERAKYLKTITQENGVTTTTVTNIKKNEVEFSNSWKGDEPVGMWVILTGKGPEQVDYNFDVEYRSGFCNNDQDLQDLKGWQLDDMALGYNAPTIQGEKDIMSYLVKRLRYPSKAWRAGLQGTVHLQFTITEEGSIENVVVTKGVHILLDKEAVRLFRDLKFSLPPMVNGKPRAVCGTFPLKYKLS